MSRAFTSFEDGLKSRLPEVAAAPDRFRAQALCRVVGEPTLAWTYRVGSDRSDREYIYPASRVKLVLAIASLEWVNQLARDTGLPINETTPLSYQPLFDGEIVEDHDTGDGEYPAGQPITVERLIWRAIVASENEPSNKLYEFVGWQGMRAWAARHRLPRIAIEHRLSEFRDRDEQRWTPGIVIRGGEKGVEIPELRPGRDALHDAECIRQGERIGAGHVNPPGTLIHEGLDFTFKNRFDLSSTVDVLDLVYRNQFDLTRRQVDLLHRAMTTPPQASETPRYQGAMWDADRFKPMMSGLVAVRPSREWVIANKIGEAYGFASDMATITHLPTGRVAHVAANIWCCASGILNADQYEYDTVGRPFLALVGEQVARLLMP